MKTYNVIVLVAFVLCDSSVDRDKRSPSGAFRKYALHMQHSRRAESCMTPLGSLGLCLTAQNCTGMDYDIDIRSSQRQCPLYTVCCPLTGNRPPARESAVSRTSATTDQPTPARVETLSTPTCGVKSPDEYTEVRMLGFHRFESTSFAQYPWMVALLTYRRRGRRFTLRYSCGGSLVHPRVVLTAAHCVLRRAHTVARAGVWDLDSEEESLLHQDRAVKEYLVHPEFDTFHLKYDAALLILEQAYEPASNIGFVCLPSLRSSISYSSVCRATGWGRAKYEDRGSYEGVLRMIELVLLERAKCEEELRTTDLGPHFVLDPSFVCAGGTEGVDACGGDSGSPLVCRGNGRYYQHGIVSWGIKCGANGVPGVYTDVLKIKPWIDEQMSTHGLTKSTYT